MTTIESKGRFFNETNRFESSRIANWNALLERPVYRISRNSEARYQAHQASYS